MLKDKPIKCISSVTDAEVESFQSHLTTLFPNLHLSKLQKHQGYNAWKAKHCIENHYLFMIRKCQNSDCCTSTGLSRDKLFWPPSPLLDVSKEHYVLYESLKSTNASDEKDCNLCKNLRDKKLSSGCFRLKYDYPFRVLSCHTYLMLTVYLIFDNFQNARAMVVCIECKKPRVIYCNKKLDVIHRMILARALSSCDYTCGSNIFPPME